VTLKHRWRSPYAPPANILVVLRCDTAAESARLIATEVGLDGAPSYRHVILESQHVAMKHLVGAGGAIQKPSENLSDCGTAPYHRFFLVRNEEAGGSNPLSSTRFQTT